MSREMRARANPSTLSGSGLTVMGTRWAARATHTRAAIAAPSIFSLAKSPPGIAAAPSRAPPNRLRRPAPKGLAQEDHRGGHRDPDQREDDEGGRDQVKGDRHLMAEHDEIQPSEEDDAREESARGSEQ